MAKVDEIPEGWGLIELTKGGLRKKKNAMWREIGDMPTFFVAALARRLADEKPTLPKAVWVVEGRDMDKEALDAYVEKQSEHNKWKWQREAQQEEHERSKDTANLLRELQEIIRSYMGWDYTLPGRFKEWCELHTHRDRDYKLESAYRMMRKLRDNIDEILDNKEKK
jgi:hypothetical protein